MKTPRVGVVGVGHIGKNHARLYAELPSARFTAIYDTDRAVAEKLAAEYGVKSAASLEEFAEQIDAASIATPTNTHFEIGRELLALVNRARAEGRDPELELRAAALAYADRVRAWEAGQAH